MKRQYSFVGGYPIFYVADSIEHGHGAFCASCADELEQDDGTETEPHINWESELYCEGCSSQIESAYGEEDE